MPAVQGGNLADVYGQMFASVAGGLLARADFPASRLNIGQFLDIVQPIAIAAVRRVADTVTDMSVVTPPVTDYDTGYSLGSSLYTAPQDSIPNTPYVRPTTVVTPGGGRVPFRPEGGDGG